MFNVGMVMCGFRIDDVTNLPDVNGRMWRMTYEKNGAELVWLEREDEVKTFVIAFKTLPEDDTGVAHILEHSVLGGSQKYPVKSPFDELRKSSLRVFMNAMTSRDGTYYPFSTRNNQDFLNLADVYLDAVFHPNVVKNPLTFLQEGWRYEITPQTGDLSYNGVVYNEMKGVYAEPEHIAGREILHYLYPDIVYGNDSGGKPRAIPSLTYEKFCAFYRKFYHPSNSRIFLDGSVDLIPILEKLNSFLSEFDRVPRVTPIPLQTPVATSATIPYASMSCTRKTILADGWSVGTFQNLVRQAALDVLVEYLSGSNEAPLKQAVLSRGLCDDLDLFWFNFQQIPLIMVIRNTSDDLAAQCRSVVKETIVKLLKDGLDQQRILALINKNEFSERECNSSRPRGLVFFGRAIRQWYYDGNPAAAFDITGIYRQLRDGVQSGLFEQYLQEFFINNNHHAELTFSPSGTCGENTAQEISEELRQRRMAMSESEYELVKRRSADLAAYQKREDSKSAKDTIPTIRISDIPKSGSLTEHFIQKEGTITRICTKATTKGIAYISAYFPLDGLDAGELIVTPLLAKLLGKLSTSVHDALSLQTEISKKVGRMTFSTTATARGNFLLAKIAVLEDKSTEATELFREVLFQTHFKDVQTIEKIQRQKRIATERDVSSAGHALAECYCAREISRRWTSRDILHGYAQLRWLQNSECNDLLTQELDRLYKRIFVRDGLILSFTDNLPQQALEMLENMLDESNGEMLNQMSIAHHSTNLRGIQIDGDSGYSGTVTFLPDDFTYTGAMRVAAKILSLEYLHREIREIGGAYGTAMTMSPSGLISSYTYRDPTPVASISKIHHAGDALMPFVHSNSDLDRFIAATIAGIDCYRSPAAEASRPVELYMDKRTTKDEEIVRQQVLETTRGNLDKIAQMLQAQMAKAKSLVIGGTKQVQNLMEDEIEPLNYPSSQRCS